jgi:nucleotide-binding universal stress UspA family protein
MGNHILCGVDASPASACAAGVAAHLSHRLDMEAMLMHVEPDDPPRRGPAGIVHARERGRLRALVDGHGFSIGTRVRVETGRPARTLVGAGRFHDSQLIVLGSHGGTESEPSIGSVAAEVVRRAPSPVVLVPPVVRSPFGDDEASSVVCVIQESKREVDVLKLADDLAARLGGSLYAVHARRAGLVHPATALLSLAEEMCAGMIVVGADARGLAAPIAANARCPVVALPHDAELAAGSGNYELEARAA